MSEGVKAFLYREARLLDEALYEDWLALFTDRAWYWVPIEPKQENPFDMVSIIYDDRRLLETRVRRLCSEHMHAQSPPSRTSRIIGNIVREPAVAPGDAYACDFAVSSRFQLVEFREDRQRLFAGGQLHGLVRAGESYKIAWKRVDLVNCDAMMEGIVVPF